MLYCKLILNGQMPNYRPGGGGGGGVGSDIDRCIMLVSNTMQMARRKIKVSCI